MSSITASTEVGKKLGKVDLRWLARLTAKEQASGYRPQSVNPPYGHRCAVCGEPVEKGHPLHRARES